jgi:hypothetical protein
MPSEYNQLRPLAFQLDQEVVAPRKEFHEYPFWTLDLPEELKRSLLTAIAKSTNRPMEKVSLPMHVLNSAARMLIPGLLSIERYAGRVDTQPWLYGSAYSGEMLPTSAEAILLLVRSWIRTSFPGTVPQPTRHALAQQVSTDAFTWRRETMDIASWKCAVNGTALPYEKGTVRNGFVLWPDLIAARFAQAQIPWGYHQLTFKRIPLGPGQRGVELVSWPPLEETVKRKVWPYSVLLTLTLQTVPFQNFPVLHCDIGVRRWAGPKIYLKSDVETSVYLLDQVPWIQGLPQHQSFQVAPVKWGKVGGSTGAGASGGSQLVWGNQLVPLLEDLHIGKNHFPDPQELADNPLRFIHQDHGSVAKPSAAIVYRNGLKPQHEMGTGFMPGDRRPFAEAIAALLQPEFQFIPPFERRKYSVAIPQNPFFEGSKKNRPEHAEEIDEPEDSEGEGEVGDAPLVGTVAERLKAVAATTSSLTLIIRYQSAEVLQALREAIEELLGYPMTQTNGMVWSSQDVTMIAETQPLGEMGERLTLKSGNYTTLYDRQRSAISLHATRLAAQIPATQECVGVLIELDNEDKFGDDDPKQALRIGFGRKGYLTQFITPVPDTTHLSEREKAQAVTQLRERARAAVRDLLRQFGVIGLLPVIPATSRFGKRQGISLAIPDPLHYLGVWLIKLSEKGSPTHIYQNIPVLLHMASHSWEINVLAPGWPDWLSYNQALLALLTQPLSRGLTSKEIHQFWLENLHRCLPAFGDTLLFCHAQNIRGVWKWFGNEQITRELPKELQMYDRLRIVRLRTGDHEIPEWYAQNDKDEYGFTKGVFALDNHNQVFACLQEKPVTAQTSPQASRVLSRVKFDKKTQEEKVYKPIPNVRAWNPGICEMTISCANPEDALMCAAVTNELRYHFASHFRSPTIYPIPLHLASLLDEYVLPLNKPLKSTGNEPGEEE